MLIDCPVIGAASSLQRNATRAPTSSTVTIRPSGWMRRNFLTISSLVVPRAEAAAAASEATSSVSTKPGAIRLAVTPCLTHSADITRVSPSRACLVDE